MDTGNECYSVEGTSEKASVQAVNTKNLIKPAGGKRSRRPPPASVSRNKTPTKSSTRKEPKPGAKHPKYRSMIMTAIDSKISRNGVSLRAILNYIQATFEVSSNSKFVNTQVKKALANMVEDCVAILVTGTIGTGYFKLKSSQKSKSKSGGNSNVKANKKAHKKLLLTKSGQSNLDDMNSTFTKSPGTSKSTKTKSRELGKVNTPHQTKTKRVISSKRKSLLPKNLKRSSLLHRRKSVSKDSTKKSGSKKSKAKSPNKVPEKSVKKPKNIQKKPLAQVERKSPKVKEELSKASKATKSKSVVQNSKRQLSK
ncbi:histone H1-delta [Octopus bimaculoides]|uniref:H15 domain-containing protein n=1 Tax=Octopus bimaculoides TaxID=37653 RepID=A0A0L8GTX8_OCTBM|nr:histone H1-delta [Octopus bimaculoides]|eukprot:XP_014778044.1 PREDICTED: histone H1-delta-like [Octopus bimaculoides]